jgi:hypothetical protein
MYTTATDISIRFQRKAPQKCFEGYCCVSSSKTNANMTSELITSRSANYGVSDHHLHYVWQWLAPNWLHQLPILLLWFHQLPTVDEDGHIVICTKLRANNCTESPHPEFLSHFWMEQQDSVMMSASTQEAQLINKITRILVQAATSIWGSASFCFTLSLYKHTSTPAKAQRSLCKEYGLGCHAPCTYPLSRRPTYIQFETTYVYRYDDVGRSYMCTCIYQLTYNADNCRVKNRIW